MHARCAASGCGSRDEMRLRDGRAFYPQGWRVLAYRKGGKDVALCPGHFAALVEWERRASDRMAAEKLARRAQNVP